jgi:hypothetical protein
MKKLLACMLVILFGMSMGLSEMSFGQEEETDYSYGKVVSVKGNSITISEVIYDENADEETYQEVTYTITQDAKLENVSSIDTLEAGKEVDIEYVEKDGEKIAIYLYVYTGKEE